MERLDGEPAVADDLVAQAGLAEDLGKDELVDLVVLGDEDVDAMAAEARRGPRLPGRLVVLRAPIIGAAPMERGRDMPPIEDRPEWLETRRVLGRGAERTRGVELAGLARPESFSRWTLPITALRVTPSPSTAAIWLALRPSIHSFLSSSTRSSVQPI